MTTTTETKLSKLRRFNIIMGFFHLVQGLLMLALSSDFALPVTTAFQVFDEGSNRLVSDLRTAFDLPIGPVVASFLLLSAVAHFLIAAPRINRWYGRNLLKETNYARWIEYSISSSLLIVVVSMLVGIYDVVALIAIFSLNAMMILFGWVMELHNQTTEKTDWTSYWFGSIAGIIPWIGIAIYLIGAGEDGQGPPTFVYAIFFSIFLFFNVFAINMVFSIARWEGGVTTSTGSAHTSFLVL